MSGGGDKTGGQWGDLRTRVVSGVILAALGIGLLASTGVVLVVGLSILVGLMMWELARLTGDLDQPERNERHARLTGLVAGLAFAGTLLLSDFHANGGFLSSRWAYGLPLLPLIIGFRGAVPRNRVPFLVFALAIFGAAYGILITREQFGPEIVFWVAGIVVVSDISGYFAGRAFGGPKFWPSISPKKTWSGTVAGWVGAFLFTLVLLLAAGDDNWSMLIAGPMLALAGQFGDIAESWLKRRVGVKDSSNLIPGHGGVLDRFDAMAGAFLLGLFGFMLFAVLFALHYPLAGG